MESDPEELLLATSTELNCCAAALLAAGYHTQHMPSGTPEARLLRAQQVWRSEDHGATCTRQVAAAGSASWSAQDHLVPLESYAAARTAGSQAPSARAGVFCIYIYTSAVFI